MLIEENGPKRYRRTKADLEAGIIKSAETLIKKKGFSAMLVTDLMKKAKIEPPVFYNRYNNLDEFFDDFVKKYDYWFKDVVAGSQFPSNTEAGYVSIFKEVRKALVDRSVMLELLRWEIAEGNETTKRTAMLREMHTLPLVRSFEECFKDSAIDIAAISSLIIGGIYYLNLHRDRSLFSGIDVKSEEGQERIEHAIETLGRMIYRYDEVRNEKAAIAERLKREGVSQDVIDRCVTL
uniref:TetR/AcrR family transcriptional regulator n=1 Tax=Prevotella sp. GTC17260 TaxID=3236796 RepID=A0AB33J8N4_9BACT